MLKQREETGPPWDLKRWVTKPPARSQTLTIPSAEPEARRVEVGSMTETRMGEG